MKPYIRLPHSDNTSLKQWNAVDEYFLDSIEEIDSGKDRDFLIFGDRFGYLSDNLIKKGYTSYNFIDSKSQYDSIRTNTDSKAIPILLDEEIPSVQNILIKIPKSLTLLDIYLKLIGNIKPAPVNVKLGFMTKYFNKGILSLLSKYYEKIEQSKAWKKSRLISVQDRKTVDNEDLIVLQDTPAGEMKQYKGVFSEQSIDIGTRFLLENIHLKNNENSVLDIGSGNGIIGKYLIQNYEITDLHMMDDSYVAYLSGKLNVKNASHEWDYSLSGYSDNQFDIVISNPPFHFGHEIDLSIPMNLLKSSARILSPDGRLVIVANNNINYKSVLSDYFTSIAIINRNEKFYIMEAVK